MSGFIDVTDTDGKTIRDILVRVPSFQSLTPFVQEKILAPEFITGMERQVENFSTVNTIK